MEKSVKGATKIKLAAPKIKYVEPILAATRGGDSGVADVFRTLQLRLRDSTWTIVFKSLIVVHLMIREGQPEVTLKFIADSPKRIAISTFTEAQTQGVNIRRYYEYLLERVKSYRDTKTDFVRSGAGKMKGLTVDKGLLRQTESVQQQIRALLKCDLLGSSEPDNEISITGFRLLTLDLLELFRVMNEGTINVLEHYFEMSKVDAERALNIYKTFGRQTEQVVQYLSTARQFEAYTKLEVPKLKHAPTTLTSSLEEYLNDPHFETNRRQYLAQQEAKRTGRPMPKAEPVPTSFDKPATSSAKPSSAAPTTTTTTTQPKGPAPDLIDFFDSIEQRQQPMAQGSAIPQQQFDSSFMPQQQYQQPFQQQPVQQQQTGYNPFLQGYQQPPQIQQQPQPLQTDFTGAGFGGYGPQPTQQNHASIFGFQPQLTAIPQDTEVNFQQQQQQQQSSQSFQMQQAPQLQAQPTSTNPFRQSTMMSPSTNPFAQSPPPSQQQAMSPAGPQSLQPQMTGTNPFAKNRSAPPAANPIPVNVTGSTNPFRQSQFVSQATGQGWQHSNQGTFAGFDMNNVGTTPVFPRPGHS